MKHKRILTPLVTLMLSVILAGIAGGNPLHASASGVDNIIARADYWYSITWTAQRDVEGWRNQSVYQQGQTYHLPYGQPINTGKYLYYGIPVESLLEASRDPSSEFYTERSLNAANGNAYSIFYATDCSSFCSYCWNLPERTTTYHWSGLPVQSLGKCTLANIAKIEPGDVLNKSASHVVLVTRILDNGTYEITEQTVPEMKRSYYTAEELVKKYSAFTIYRYNYRNDVPPPERVKFCDGEKSLVTAHDAVVSNWIVNRNEQYFETGIRIGLYPDKMRTFVTGTHCGWNEFFVEYRLKEKIGALLPQTTYYYQFYMLSEDQTRCFNSEIFSVTTPGVRYDVNGDDVFDTADVQLVQSWLMKAPDAALCDWMNADVNTDKKVDVYDLAVLKSKLRGNG